ncbi:MAG TPA: hypothetical protein VLX92_17415 [Kofleriaceae bacterium]|nr:hypothetical protein [Kofleriaceae bacterium]
MRTVLVLVLAIAAGCAAPLPASFPAGDRWTFPLVDPLADDRLIVPVAIDGRGPYLLVLDPEAPRTIVDAEAIPGDAPALDATTVRTGTLIPRAIRTLGGGGDDRMLSGVRIGELALDQLRVAVAEPHAFDADGRRLYGVIGRDVLDPSLVFGFDRDLGVAYLATGRAFRPPRGARTLDLDARASIGDAERRVTIDLGRSASQIDGPVAGAVARPEHGAVLDELGASHRYDHVVVAPRVSYGGITRSQLVMVPSERGDARLGLDFFRAFDLALDRAAGRLYLVGRDGHAAARAARLARWGPLLPGCANARCVRLAVDGDALTVTPEAGVALQVVVRATAPDGSPLPDLELALPAATPVSIAHLGARYAGAMFQVVDLSPYPRRCPAPGPCAIAG